MENILWIKKQVFERWKFLHGEEAELRKTTHQGQQVFCCTLQLKDTKWNQTFNKLVYSNNSFPRASPFFVTASQQSCLRWRVNQLCTAQHFLCCFIHYFNLIYWYYIPFGVSWDWCCQNRYLAVSCQRNNKFCDDFCVRAVKASGSSQQEQGRPCRDLKDRSPQGHLGGCHTQRACAGRGRGRTYFRCISMSFRELNPLWFGH